jgi:flagellar basal-body rod modification protein FlgD
MSGSIASVAAQQAAANASSNQSSQSSSQNALSQLSGNFSDFLNMLMIQLQNQDPTSPLDTNQFTSELVEFSGVEQQINTNNSLTQLIQLTQAGEVMQGSAMAGKQVSVTSTQIPLQNGSGSVNFTAPRRRPRRSRSPTPAARRCEPQCSAQPRGRTPGPGTASRTTAPACRMAPMASPSTR